MLPTTPLKSISGGGQNRPEEHPRIHAPQTFPTGREQREFGFSRCHQGDDKRACSFMQRKFNPFPSATTMRLSPRWIMEVLSCSLVAYAASVTVQSNTLLDSSWIYFVSYDGLVNLNSFEISGIITHNGYQYATWYTSSRYAMIGRRQLGANSWSTIQLPHQLSTNDSHDVVVVGVLPKMVGFTSQWIVTPRRCAILCLLQTWQRIRAA